MRILALDIGGTSIKSAVCEGETLTERKEQDTDACLGGEFVMQRAAEILKSYGPCDAIGISTAGQVDVQEGKIRYANDNIPGYTGMEIRKRLEAEFRVPVAVENDVNAAAIGEGHFGAARGFEDYLCLTYGTGVGGAIVIGKQIFRGVAGSAGEVGSVVIHGRQVVKGRRISGCYEDYASTSALIRTVHAYDPDIHNGRELFERIANDPVLQTLLDDWIWEIAHGLVTLIHIFNPQCILLGGGVMAQDYVVEKVKEVTLERIMPSFRDVVFKRAGLGNRAGLWGAVHLAKERVGR